MNVKEQLQRDVVNLNYRIKDLEMRLEDLALAHNKNGQVMQSMISLLMLLQEKAGLTDDEIKEQLDKKLGQSDTKEGDLQPEDTEPDEDSGGAPKLRLL